MKKAIKSKRTKAASKKAADNSRNVALAGIKAVTAPKTPSGAKPNVRFNNFEKRSTYEAVAQLAETGSRSMKSAREKLRLMGWDKHELDAR
jgi:hypothetical protein